MTDDSDLKAFSETMKGLAEIFDSGKPLSAIKLEIYFRAMQDHSIQEIKMAAAKLVKTRVYSTFPKPAEFLGLIDGKEDDQPKLAWAKVDQAVRSQGPYASVQFDDPVIHSVVEALGGWAQICSCTDKEWVWKQKDFEELYPLMAKKPDHPHFLGGSISGDPVQIGDTAKAALKLIAGGSA